MLKKLNRMYGKKSEFYKYFKSLDGSDEALDPLKYPSEYFVFEDFVDGKKQNIGVVGIVIVDNNIFPQLVIDKKFRGKGYPAIMLNDLIYNLGLKGKTLFITIKNGNNSIKSAIKYGFKELPEVEQEKLRKAGKLKKNETRLFYENI